MLDLENIIKKTKQGAQNWAIDTSAKVIAYAPMMGAMEAYNGLDGKEILKSRAAAALIDGVVARVYTKTADYLSNRFKVDPKKGGIKGWALDTAAMVGVYTPVYGAILAANDVEPEQIGAALAMGAGIAAVAARPFGKYILEPMRKKFGYKR